jgi:ankyrin repeat protein
MLATVWSVTAVGAGQQPRGALIAADGTTPLHLAVRDNDEAKVRALLAAGADARAATRLGVTPLQLAAVNGDPAIARLLLAAGADANVVLPEGETILMTAARTGNPELVTLLLDRGADINAREKWYGETALIWAAAEDHAEAIRVLVARGADPDGRSSRLDVPRRRTGQSVLPLGSWTPLMYAARQNALAAIGALVDRGADPNQTDPDGATALVIAIINANYDAAALLVEMGADPNIADNDAGMAALYAAVDMHRPAVGHGRPNPKLVAELEGIDLIRLLLKRGANPNARLKASLMQRHHTAGDASLAEGATPLMRAAKSGDVAVMRLLLEAGADPKLVRPNQATALHFAAGLGWRDGSPAAPSYDQGTEQDAVAAITLCVETGLDINATTTTGDTALHAAVSGRGSEMIVRHLVESGANLQARNKQGRTPLDVAVASRNDRSKIADFLRQRMKSSP